MIQMLITDPSEPGAECKGVGEFSDTGEMAEHQETGRSCKLIRYGDVASKVSDSIPKICKDDHVMRDPCVALGVDIFHYHVLTLLDLRSLARCAAVCSRWRSLATADELWQPLVGTFLSHRAHLPLCLMGRDFSCYKGQNLLYNVAMMDSLQRDLIPAEMCGRTWELRLKPSCGPYWLGFDPTQVGKRGLKRYFHCDGSITSGPNDPIWDGHSSVWKIVHLKEGESGRDAKYVQINRRPPLTPRRVKDGRWVLENFYGLYITRPDNPNFVTKRCREADCKRVCRNSCTPPTYGVKICALLPSDAGDEIRPPLD